MKNIKGRMLRKLKKITISPTWKNPSSLSALRPSTNENRNPSPPMSESPLAHVEEQHLADGENEEKKLTSPTRSKEKLTSANPVDLQPCPKLEISKNILEDQRCPPGGREAVVLYSTSLRGIRKTFEDCNAIRFLLGSFRVVYSERDVSMHMEYREELWGILGGRVVPPRLFIRGRYVGGADEVVGLHENGVLRTLLRGIPLMSPSSCPCGVCAGQRFVLCATCSGSRRVLGGGRPNGTPRVRCPDCNENGLVKCSLCTLLASLESIK